MLTAKFIHENLNAVKDMLQKRHVSLDIEHILDLDAKRISLIQKIEALRKERNKISSKQQVGSSQQRGREIKEELKLMEPELKAFEAELAILLREVPNMLSPNAPEGRDESENVVLREHGQKPEFKFTPKDHLEIAQSLDLIDFEKGASVTGSQWYFLKNDLVLLEHALIRFAFDMITKEGFNLFQTPDVAKLEVLEGIGFNPRGPETQIYRLEGGELGLVGTAEITLGGYHRDEILSEKQLPLKLGGFSHCFRTEAGGYGRYSKGLYRVHQFSKVEMFVYCLPQDSDTMHEKLLAIEESIYQALVIPYRVVDIVAGDLGAAAYRKYDIEAWLPGRGDYGEVTSTSNTTDYQSRRLNIKYRKKDNSTDYIHTLNGTAIATSRTMIAILENYQQKDGSVKVPEVLIPYMGKKTIGK